MPAGLHVWFHALLLLEAVQIWNWICCTFFIDLSIQQVDRHGCLQVHPGAMEEEAIGRDAIPPPCPLLAVSPAVCLAPSSPAHQTRQSSQAGV